jgi:hypothetical protein
MPFPRVRLVNCPCSKAELPIEVTELGIVKEVKPTAPRKADDPIVVTFDGIVIAESVDSENDEFAIVVTLAGIV